MCLKMKDIWNIKHELHVSVQDITCRIDPLNSAFSLSENF
jgi:hypothetical protein